MGCWNGTCALTNMPIKHGDKIVVFPIKRNKYADTNGAGFTYTHNQYSPISIPIFAEYDDYGGVENVSQNGDIVYNHLIRLINSKQIKCEKTPDNIEQLVNELIGEGNIEDVGIMMVHEKAYRLVIDEVGSRKLYETNVTKRESIQQYAEEFVEKSSSFDISDFEERLKELLNKENKTEDEHRELNKIIDCIVHLKTRDIDNGFSRYFSSFESNYSLMRSLLEDVITQKDKQMLNTMIEIILFDISLDLLRKMWIPQAGAGSQCNELYLHKILAEYVIEHEQEIKNEYGEDEESNVTKATFLW